LAGLDSVEAELAGLLPEWVSDSADYDPLLLADTPIPYEYYEKIRNANLAVIFRRSPPAYVDGLLDGIGIPTISLALNRFEPAVNWPPAEYLPREVEDSRELRQILAQEIALFEEDFLELENQSDVDQYSELLVDLQGEYDSGTRERIREVVMGDKYVASGQIGAVGPGAHVHDVTFNQIWNSFPAGEEDLPALAAELEQLRVHLRSVAQTREQDVEVAEIGAAAAAAEAKDGSGVMSHLSKVGKWALTAATSIGTALATAAIKHAAGI